MIIPLYEPGCPRVTHPSAARFCTEALPLARLACVKHAASVHPEPGSNSYIFSSSCQNSSFWLLFFLSYFLSSLHLSWWIDLGLVSSQLFSSQGSIFNGGEDGIWTHAPLLTTYSLSRGAPSTSWVLLQKLSLFSLCSKSFLIILAIFYFVKKFFLLFFFLFSFLFPSPDSSFILLYFFFFVKRFF